MKPTYCHHVSPTGLKCHGWARADGLCAAHAGIVARGPAIYTPREKRHNADRLAALHAKQGWVAACGCVTGKGE